ncbi:HAD-IC family P-type ATPase [Microbaculum marinisediminis]|uniref:HAD-IC family P-type ATPase n=1 Tax=Microbaculum marinisediminis TaxID=2931392 RepID=A0AAW5QU07_9HYPH|nr:HAD-IC family P-type ATPase [Microbaculum sp. A6E488]MCT8971556.1 HAD-IC family P-type ATPase [Microbaculum sp. A6E488]
MATGNGKSRTGDFIAWHALSTRDALERLQTEHTGLSARDAAARLRRFGPNLLPEAPRRPAWLRFLAHFHNVLVYLLIAAAAITVSIGHYVDAVVIVAVVVVNAVIGFVQEGRAEAALEAIRKMLSPQAAVLRDGRRLTLDAAELVPGDVVLLEPGDRVPADLRLLHVKGLEIDEAVLTGESLPVGKQVATVGHDAAIGDRADLAFFGTLVTRGHASGVVVETGPLTEIGRIGTLIEGIGTVTTPLLRRVARFGQGLAAVVLVASAAVFAWGVLVDRFPMGDMFLAAVGLAVAAIPEELPAILTIALAFGVERMARRHAIVRRLPAVEALGSVTVICSDKTGTLTRNDMVVEEVATDDTLYRITGTGYTPDGGVLVENGPVDGAAEPALVELARASGLCSDARLRRDHNGDWHVEGDPMEGALLAFAAKVGIDRDEDSAVMPRLDTIPFESESQLMATLHRVDDGGVIYVKGAPERLLALCDRQRDRVRDERIDLAMWHRRLEDMTAAGERVIAVACRAVPASLTDMEFGDLEEGLTMLGLIGLADPPRPEAISAVADCRAAGIRIKMITGDHPETARAIAGRFGLSTDEVMTGRDFDLLAPGELAQRAAEIDVFARTSPEHKLRLVEALQNKGEIVAMTGDGVNDAPALKRADVGVAMGIKGSEAAKEAAQIVLADDNFASIAKAVQQGRTIYENIRKSIAFMLPTNGGEAMIVIGAILVGLPLPITPIQILWINMVTTVTLALALAVEPAEADIMKRPPRPPGEPIIGAYLIWRTAYVSVLMTVAVFALFIHVESDNGLDHARSLAVNVIVAFEAAYLFNSRFVRRSVLSRRGLFGSVPVLVAVAAVVVLQLVFTYVPLFQTMFDTRSLSLSDWGLVVGAAGGLFLIVETEKLLARRVLWA